MSIKFKLITILIIATLAASCTWKNEEDLFAGVACELENVSFQQDIKPILASHCLVCHSSAANLGNVSLQDYEDVKVYGENGRLLGSIRHDIGYSPMPQGGSKLNSCSIDKIQAWILNDMPNN